MKALVLGASGMAGHVIAMRLRDAGFAVTSVAGSRRTTPDTWLVNLWDPVALGVLKPRTYDVVVNAVGVLIGDCALDPTRAVYLNSYLPNLLAQSLADAPTRLVHLSTDCVFSGKTGGYRENSTPDAATLYGQSKALGEIRNGKDLTFRCSIIGPELKPDGAGLFAWLMRQQGRVTGYTGHVWNGVTTLELAAAVEAAIGQGLTGLYHLTPPGTITKHGLLTMLAEEFGLPVDIVPVDPGPDDKTLVDTRRDLQYRPPGYERMVHDLRVWVDAHPDLYPHYRAGAA